MDSSYNVTGFNASFICSTLQIRATTSFTSIEKDLISIQQDLDLDLSTVDRLSRRSMKTQYDCYSPNTTRKLANLVAKNNDVRFSKIEIEKVFDILRKHNNTIPTKAPRMSSLPPTPDNRNVSEDFTAGNGIAESKSLHDIPYSAGLYENEDCDTSATNNGDILLLDNVTSSNTLEESIAGSSPNSLSTMATPASEKECISTNGVIVDIAGYVGREWKGNTTKAQRIREGYQCVMREHNYKSIARIRGDNYCALRATYCSIILNSVRCELALECTMQRLEAMNKAQPSLICSWELPGCLTAQTHCNKYAKLSECLQYFILKTQSLQMLDDKGEQVRQLLQLLNTGGEDELCMLEAMKVLMLLSAYELHNVYSAGKDVPVFVWLLFARETSETPCLLLNNHLNRVGRDSGLEQVEMCLMGYALGVTLQTFRLYQYGEVDFIALYPEDDSPKNLVPIIAEDDRHYNTLLKSSRLWQ